MKVKDNDNLYQIPELTNNAFNHNKPFYKITETKANEEDIKETIKILASQDSLTKNNIFTFKQLLSKYFKPSRKLQCFNPSDNNSVTLMVNKK